MASITPSTIKRESVGSLTLHIADFANTADNGDTWESGIQGVVGVMACQKDVAGTATSQGVGAAVTTAATGVITLYIGEDNAAVQLWVLSKS
jgi:hypothetical protein